MSRYVTIASFSSRLCKEVAQDELMGHAVGLVREAASRGADILAFPEAWCQMPLLHSGTRYRDTAEAVPGPHSEPIFKACAEHRIAAVWPMFERRGGRVYNTAIVVGADGRIAGRCDKQYLTDGELRDGVRMGEVAQSVLFKWGRVGAAICFDANFRGVWARLKEDRADIVFFPSMFSAERHLAARALEFGYYILSAITQDGAGRLVGQCGEELARSPERQLLVQRVNLERRVVHMDNNYARTASGMKAKYGDAVAIEKYDSESRYAIGVEADGLSVNDVMSEYQIEPIEEYYRRMEFTRRNAGA